MWLVGENDSQHKRPCSACAVLSLILSTSASWRARTAAPLGPCSPVLASASSVTSPFLLYKHQRRSESLQGDRPLSSKHCEYVALWPKVVFFVVNVDTASACASCHRQLCRLDVRSQTSMRLPKGLAFGLRLLQSQGPSREVVYLVTIFDSNSAECWCVTPSPDGPATAPRGLPAHLSQPLPPQLSGVCVGHSPTSCKWSHPHLFPAEDRIGLCCA